MYMYMDHSSTSGCHALHKWLEMRCDNHWSGAMLDLTWWPLHGVRERWPQLENYWGDTFTGMMVEVKSTNHTLYFIHHTTMSFRAKNYSNCHYMYLLNSINYCHYRTQRGGVQCTIINGSTFTKKERHSLCTIVSCGHLPVLFPEGKRIARRHGLAVSSERILDEWK